MRNILKIISLLVLATFLASCSEQSNEKQASDIKLPQKLNTALPKVKLETNLGEIIVQLRSDKSPVSVENFLDYVNSGFYDNTQFHRVITGFMIQGGGFDDKLNKKPTNPPIKNEAGNKLANLRGTIAMARMSAPDTATSQFFINLQNNPDLNYPAYGGGYAVFGRVIKGMEIVDLIATKPVSPQGPHRHVPVEPVIIIKATQI